MDYNMMMMETPEETMKRFERKRKLKEILCEFGLRAHKIHLGRGTHFAFVLASPMGTPIEHPCSSEDLAECSQWLARMYPNHLFFQEKPRVHKIQRPIMNNETRYDIYPDERTTTTKQSLRLDTNLSTMTAPTIDPLLTTSTPGHHDPFWKMRTTYIHDATVVRPPINRKLDLCGPKKPSHNHDNDQHILSTDSIGVDNDTNYTKIRARKREYTCQREKGSSHIEHHHHGEHKEDRSFDRHHSSRDETRLRGRKKAHNKNIVAPRMDQVSKSDEGSGIGGDNNGGPNSSGVKYEPIDYMSLDPEGRVKLPFMTEYDIKRISEYRHSIVPSHGWMPKSDKILRETSNVESKPQELSTPSCTRFVRVRRAEYSSDLSPCSPESTSGLEVLASVHTHKTEKDTTPNHLDLPRAHLSRLNVPQRKNPLQDHIDHPIFDMPTIDPDARVPKEKMFAWKPSPLYQVPGASTTEKSDYSFDSECIDADEPIADDDEACEKEERTVTKYLRLFADDKSWKEGFEATSALTCDVCKLEGKMKQVPDVKALVLHAKAMKRIKVAEHRGYAYAICKIMKFDAPKLNKPSKKCEDINRRRHCLASNISNRKHMYNERS